jgi:Ca2+-binding RTX toxin-like protein
MAMFDISGSIGDDTIKIHEKPGGVYSNSTIVDRYGGNDRLFGGSFDDFIWDGDGNDAISGAGGGDYLEDLGGNDRLLGGDGNDFIIDLSGDDVILGGEGDDEIRDLGGQDTIAGGAGRDIIWVRNDTSDTISGLADSDRISGGSGADVFDFIDVNETLLLGFAPATITDFSSAEGDLLVLQGQGYVFIGSNGFHGVAGEVRYDVIRGNAVVELDIDGDGSGDLTVAKLLGVTSLVAGDFAL